jgi:hypothetical protein
MPGMPSLAVMTDANTSREDVSRTLAAERARLHRHAFYSDRIACSQVDVK